MPGRLEDRRIAEYRDESARRWTKVDAQLDATWNTAMGSSGDPDHIRRRPCDRVHEVG